MDAVTPAPGVGGGGRVARRRAEVEVHVLRRALPELEEALDAQSGLLQASLAQQQTLARVRIQQDAALREAKATNQHLTAEVAGLRAQNDALERQAHAQAAELARLRERLGGASTDTARRPAAAGFADPPPHADHAGAAAAALAPLSPLLGGDEAAPRSRARAYWRRADVPSHRLDCRLLAGGGARKLVSTPKPGHVGRVAQVALGGGATPAKPPSAEVEAERALAPQLAALRRRSTTASASPSPSPSSPPSSVQRAAAARRSSRLRRPSSPRRRRGGGGGDRAESSRRRRRAPARPRRRAARVGARGGRGARGAERRGGRQASQQAPAWAAAVRAAAHSVVELNMPPLTEHLRTILHDNCASAVRSLQARGADAASEEAAKAKAAQVISALTAAVDNVQRQFVGGLRSALSPSVAAQAGAAVVAKMCEEAVKARCAPLLALASVDDVALRIYHSVSVMHTFSAEVTKSGAAGWLASLLCGRVTLDLPPDLHTFVTTAIARHLDPYIDGEVLSPPTRRPRRGIRPSSEGCRQSTPRRWDTTCR